MSIPCSQETHDVRQEFKAALLPLLDDLHRVARRLCRSNDEAEELVAETVVRACESFSTLRDTSKAKQWLLRILSNTFLSTRRSRKVRQEISFEEDDQTFSLFDELAQPFLWWGNPEREVINRFLDEDIAKALSSLPEEFRVAVVLCTIEGHTYEEIAATLTIPIGTVRSRLARGRSLLQKNLYQHALERGWITAKKPIVQERE
jgi:RNA polymerase sigma-70 factor (ECF subfamily)